MHKLYSILLACTTCTFAEVTSDINHIDTRFEWAGVPALRIGDQLRFHNLVMGGIIETRNEARFNQEPLSNHQWRGFARMAYEQPIRIGDSITLTVPLELNHESAHATMGIQEPTNSAFESIYDGQYRNVNRNAVSTGLGFTWKHRFTWTTQGNYLLYIKSRNTPEAPNTERTMGHGMSFGTQLQSPSFTKLQLEVLGSVFYRQEFASAENRIANIYYDTPTGPELKRAYYPLWNATRTVSGLLSLSMPIGNKRLGLFGQWTFGNLGGYMDSRQELHRIAGGIMLSPR